MHSCLSGSEEMLKTEAVAEFFTSPRDLANVIVLKKCLIAAIAETQLNFVTTCGKYGTIFCHRLAVKERVHILLISVFLVREHQDIQNGCHHLIQPRCFQNDKRIWLLYHCSSVK